MKFVAVIFFTTILILIIVSCTRDQISEIITECGDVVTYDNQIRPIISTTCAYSGCHAGGAPGNFTSYKGISKYFDSGLIERKTIFDRTMPPNYSSLGPSKLSDEEIVIFKCWIQSGYPEN